MFTVLTILGGYLIFVGMVVAVGRAAARGSFVLEPLSRKDVIGKDVPGAPSAGSPEPVVRAPRAASTRTARRGSRTSSGAGIAS
jgi:hypothetical protein